MEAQKEKKLTAVRNLLDYHKPMLIQMTQQVCDQDVSNYPIVVLHNTSNFDVGILFANLTSGWEIRISTAEEFSARQLIANEKLHDFLALYRKHSERDLSVFVLTTEGGADFLFVPKYKL